MDLGLGVGDGLHGGSGEEVLVAVGPLAIRVGPNLTPFPKCFYQGVVIAEGVLSEKTNQLNIMNIAERNYASINFEILRYTGSDTLSMTFYQTYSYPYVSYTSVSSSLARAARFL